MVAVSCGERLILQRMCTFPELSCTRSESGADGGGVVVFDLPLPVLAFSPLGLDVVLVAVVAVEDVVAAPCLPLG